MRWNPLSEKRRLFLVNWTTRYLAKKNKRLSQKDQHEELAFHLGLIDTIGLSDPTPSGEYSKWIMKMLIHRELNYTEDFDKAEKTLKTFHRIKKRLPIELRDINKYKSYLELYKVVKDFLPKTHSKQELIKMGQKIIYQDSIYTFIEITTPEAAVEVSRNMGWCTCNYDVAVDYLRTNLYVVYKYDETYLLVHPTSKQVMTEGNDPYDDNDPHLLGIFKYNFPELYCDKHPPSGELKNKLCSDCGETAGCSCNISKCGEPGCAEVVCSSCVKKCRTCEVYYCAQCIKGECCVCGHDLCKEDVEECSNCDGDMCADHKQECSFCDYSSCDECMEICPECGLHACKDCYFECGDCQDEKCKSCATDRDNIDITCHECDKDFCQDCLQICSSCKKIVCRECITEENLCDTCEYDREFEEEENRQNPEGLLAPCGQCFPWALNDAARNGGVLVHGWVIDQAKRKYWGIENYGAHAWVERGGLVYDWQRCDQGYGKCPITLKHFNRMYRPINVRRYPRTSKLFGKWYKEGHYGPWHKESWSELEKQANKERKRLGEP